MTGKRKTGIYLLTDTGSEIEILLVGIDGQTTSLTDLTPATALTTFVNLDLSHYKQSVETLWEEHPVFEERDSVPISDYENFEKQAVPLSEQLRERDPIAYLDISLLVETARKLEDTGDPIFASRKAYAILEVLRIPYRIQNRMRNIFEITFADFERGTQQQRFHALESVWPGILDRRFPIRLIPDPSGQNPISAKREYHPDSLYELCLIELSLYFQQSKKRIARCENCWRYFVPKTTAKTLYCDGKVDGVACKDSGPKLKHRFDADIDAAIAAYNRLRHTLSERANRYEDAAPWEREKLKPFSKAQYADWLKKAQRAKDQYDAGKMSSEEFLQPIDVFNDIVDYTAEKTVLPNQDRTPWREAIKRDIDFDPEKAFVDMNFLDLSEGISDWELITRQEQVLQAQGGHQSLHSRYGDKLPAESPSHTKALDTLFSEQDGEKDEAVQLMQKAFENLR